MYTCCSCPRGFSPPHQNLNPLLTLRAPPLPLSLPPSLPSSLASSFPPPQPPYLLCVPHSFSEALEPCIDTHARTHAARTHARTHAHMHARAHTDTHTLTHTRAHSFSEALEPTCIDTHAPTLLKKAGKLQVRKREHVRARE